MSELHQEQNSVKKCKYCGTEINLNALVCPTCKFYQKRWKNIIGSLGGGASVITLCVSALLFSGNEAIKLFAIINWRDAVNINYLHTYNSGHFSAIISNSGNATVFVSQINIYYKTVNNYPFYINREIKSGEFLSIKNPSNDDNINEHEYKSLYGYEKNKDGRPPEIVIEHAEVWSDQRPPNSSVCYAIFFLDKTSEEINRMNRAFSQNNEKLAVSDADADIVYFDIQTGHRVIQKFQLLATYLRSTDDRCQGF